MKMTKRIVFHSPPREKDTTVIWFMGLETITFTRFCCPICSDPRLICEAILDGGK